MRLWSTAVFAGLALIFTPAAQAAPITYTFTGTATGTYGSKDFTDAVFEIDLTSSTDTVFSPVGGVLANAGPTIVSVTGVISTDPVDLPTLTFVNDSGVVGLGTFENNDPSMETDLFAGFNAALLTYNFASDFPLTPLVVTENDLQGGVSVNGKLLTVSDLSSLSFSATVSSVPLPASAPMFGAALMVLGAVGYGLKRHGKAAA